MTNFDTFLSIPQFSSFAPVAVSAERILPIDPSACVLNCRRAMEFAVKWMYSVDKALVMPYQDSLVSLMNTEDFRDIVGADIWRRMDLIRRMGNNAAHTGKKITEEQAALCLENLYILLDFVAYCYGENYTEGHFDHALLTQKSEVSAEPVQEVPEVELAALMAENAALKEELTARRAEQQQTYVPKPLDLSEYKTRKLYIDTMLTDAGWTESKDWLNEVELPGMPNKSEVGYADYVLYGDDGRPLAVVEAKRTCVDVAKGRQQAKLYADLLEKKYHRRPVIFLTNGFETRITDNLYPERKCAAIYSKRDLEKLFNLQSMRTSLKNVMVDRKIAGRYYQEGAIKAACNAFARNRRKALLVMATGSGKTRTVIALCDVLLQHGWVKNILFLADRNSLVTQAKRSFVNLLPDLSVTNLCEEKDNYTAHCVFSTYQTMYNVIDSVQDEEGKLFTCGHFDLVICDEAHRSVYNKYRDIFNYFDASLVGLTATPKDEIDKNTYEIFELENGVPTYGYELAQAVKDGYLVDFLSVETKLKFIEQGIVYDELSDEDKQAYEDTFEDENGELPERIASSALNEWIFNEDTIRQVLNTLMTHGLTIDYGPYGFLDDFQPDFICNHSDYQGRYSFENQPAVGLWNLQRLAQSLSPFISAEALNAALDEYQHALLTAYGQRMRDKLGLFSQQKGDNDLLDGLFALMIREKSDYTRTFRLLSHSEQLSAASPLRDEFIDRAAFDSRFAGYRARLRDEQVDDAQRQQRMQGVNPALVLRNWLAQRAIEQAEAGDMGELERLHAALADPFTDREDDYVRRPPDWGKRLEVSCSS